MEKYCYKCKSTLPIGRFSRDKSRKDGYMNKCAICHQASKNDRGIADPGQRASSLTPVKREYVNTLKATTPCADCGKCDLPYLMDYDHISAVKNFDVSAGIQKATITLEMLSAEIDLCELVCVRCHRIRTHNRGYRHRKRESPQTEV